MKRDPDLSRAILLFIEEHAPPQGGLDLPATLAGHDYPTIVAHTELLIEGGFVDGKVLKSHGPTDVMINKLTNRGHDALQLVSNDKTWETVKKTAVEKGTGLTFDAIFEVAKYLMRVKLGFPL